MLFEYKVRRAMNEVFWLRSIVSPVLTGANGNGAALPISAAQNRRPSLQGILVLIWQILAEMKKKEGGNRCGIQTLARLDGCNFLHRNRYWSFFLRPKAICGHRHRGIAGMVYRRAQLNRISKIRVDVGFAYLRQSGRRILLESGKCYIEARCKATDFSLRCPPCW